MMERRIPFCTALKSLALSLLVVFATDEAVSAESYPARPVRLLVPFAPGGGFDVVRVVLQSIATSTGKQFVMDNRGGAGGLIAAELAAKATPDGYTAFLAGTSTHGTLPNLHTKLPYDPVKDFSPVTMVATTPYVLVASPALGARSVKDLITLAKTKPDQLSYGSAGTGSTMHMTGELFKSMTHAPLVHVPFKGGALAVTAVLGGEIQLTFIPPSVVRAHISAGRLAALGVTSLKRSRLLPDVPTIAEAGVPGFEVTAFYGLLTPAGVSRDVIIWLNREFNNALATASVKQSFDAAGVEATGSSPAEFGAFLRAELARWAKIVKIAGARLD
jgi:tripartite-type tricarboxylate transporter receptor subunit TctC